MKQLYNQSFEYNTSSFQKKTITKSFFSLEIVKYTIKYNNDVYNSKVEVLCTFYTSQSEVLEVIKD